MIMEEKCPHCGSENIQMDVDDEEYNTSTETIVTWDCHCFGCGKDFIMSDVVTVTSRLVAKDNDELDRLIEEEIKEDMEKDRKAKLFI